MIRNASRLWKNLVIRKFVVGCHHSIGPFAESHPCPEKKSVCLLPQSTYFVWRANYQRRLLDITLGVP